MPVYPICEVFGYPSDSFSDNAVDHRSRKLCPYNNKVSTCTKVSIENPLGVCSLWIGERPAIICPVRFRQNWQIIEDTKDFLLPKAANIDYVTEASLHDINGMVAGNIDVVIVENDAENNIIDFGALEIQAVYISGNLRHPFEHYIENASARYNLPWTGNKPPRPDWLSSVKRLIRQLTVKGAILNTWGKKMAVAVEYEFFRNLWIFNGIAEVPGGDAEMGWFLYDLVYNAQKGIYELQLERTVYLTFESAMERFSTLEAGDIEAFKTNLKKKLNYKTRKNNLRLT